jgi:hypothetical protein
MMLFCLRARPCPRRTSRCELVFLRSSGPFVPIRLSAEAAASLRASSSSRSSDRQRTVPVCKPSPRQ